MFLKYLDDWEKAVQERPGFSAEEKNTMLISHETRLGLRITGETYTVNASVSIIFASCSTFIHRIPAVHLQDTWSNAVSEQ